MVLHPDDYQVPDSPLTRRSTPGEAHEVVASITTQPGIHEAIIAALPVAFEELETIKKVHEAGERDGTTLWHTDYNNALDEKHERFEQYNRLDLYDDGRIVITEIKPGEIFTDTVFIDLTQVAAVRDYVKNHGFNWVPKPQGYLKEGVDIAAYREITRSYDPTIDDKILKEMIDDSPDAKKRGGAVFAFDREAQLLPDDSLRIRLQGSHRAPVDKTGAYKIDDIPSIIRK